MLLSRPATVDRDFVVATGFNRHCHTGHSTVVNVVDGKGTPITQDGIPVLDSLLICQSLSPCHPIGFPRLCIASWYQHLELNEFTPTGDTYVYHQRCGRNWASPKSARYVPIAVGSLYDYKVRQEVQ